MSIDTSASPGAASALFKATVAVGAVGIFLAIYFAFTDPLLSVKVAAALLVGVVGVISFLRHSVFWRSDQARMGWAQDDPSFQMEVGLANLALGLVALAAVLFSWGPVAYGTVMLSYGLYLAGSIGVHLRDARAAGPERQSRSRSRSRVLGKVLNTGIFAAALLAFGAYALSL
jgi:hypothetical protein